MGMTTLSIDRGAALKEWAAVVKALESGTQILILRKGGIREEGFSTETGAFYFYPTGFHQSSGKLRAEYEHFLEEAMADKPPEGRLRIQSFGHVVDRFSVSSQDKLITLSPEYIYTVDEMKKRYEFRPGEVLTALAVRVYRLSKPVELPVRTKYGGCVSWINLEDSIPTTNAMPVLTDPAFQKRLERVRSLLL